MSNIFDYSSGKLCLEQQRLKHSNCCACHLSSNSNSPPIKVAMSRASQQRLYEVDNHAARCTATTTPKMRSNATTHGRRGYKPEKQMSTRRVAFYTMGCFRKFTAARIGVKLIVSHGP